MQRSSAQKLVLSSSIFGVSLCVTNGALASDLDPSINVKDDIFSEETTVIASEHEATLDEMEVSNEPSPESLLQPNFTSQGVMQTIAVESIHSDKDVDGFSDSDVTLDWPVKQSSPQFLTQELIGGLEGVHANETEANSNGYLLNEENSGFNVSQSSNPVAEEGVTGVRQEAIRDSIRSHQEAIEALKREIASLRQNQSQEQSEKEKIQKHERTIRLLETTIDILRHENNIEIDEDPQARRLRNRVHIARLARMGDPGRGSDQDNDNGY